MTGQLRFLAFLMLGGAASAAPMPPPPGDYQGGQYIDGRGCVFTRAGSDWSARIDGAGKPLCGFPPSLDVRRTDPESERVLPLSQLDVPPDPEAMLMDQLSQELRSGEWAADPRAAEERAAPEPARRADPMHDVLRNALAAAPSMRTATGLSASPELCERLGYTAGSGDAPHGASLGLCPGMGAAPTVTTVAAPPRGAASAPVPRPSAPVSRQQRAASAPALAARQQRAASPGASKPGTAEPAKAPVAQEMIPASARYVQVGAYSNDENAMIVLRALAARGYPTGQARGRDNSKTMRIIMAGPFADRQALIRALNDLRANGYPGAVAR